MCFFLNKSLKNNVFIFRKKLMFFIVLFFLLVLKHSHTNIMHFQTWIQDLLIQDQDQDSRLTRPILEVHDWDGL